MSAYRTGGRARVLVTGAGSAPGISTLKALRDADVDVIATAHSPYMPGLYMVDRSYVLPHASHPDYVAALAAVVERERVDVVLPMIDDELDVLGQHRHAFTNTVLAIPDAPALQRCLDKWRLHCHAVGRLSVPRTWLGSTLPPANVGRVVVKPRRGSGASGVRVHERPPTTPPGDDMVIQQHLPGREVSVDVYITRDGLPLAAVPRMRLSTELGVSSCGRTFHDAALEERAVHAALSVGLHGIANVQLREDERGNRLLLEINARVSGGMALTVAAGANLPLMLVREALGEPVRRRVAFQDLAMVRHREELFLDPAQLMDQPRGEEKRSTCHGSPGTGKPSPSAAAALRAPGTSASATPST